MSVSVQADDFDVGVEINALSAGRTDIGAVVTFTGLVRDMAGGEAIADMELEHYPGMTEKALQISRQRQIPVGTCKPVGSSIVMEN